MLSADKILRRLCGWQRAGEVPSESTFSRAFAAFAASGLPSRLHEALIKETHADRLVGHISRDSTAIEAREKPAQSDRPAPAERPKRKRGRPRKGEVRPAEPPRRIERQRSMSVTAMLAELPRNCDAPSAHPAARLCDDCAASHARHPQSVPLVGACHSGKHGNLHTRRSHRKARSNRGNRAATPAQRSIPTTRQANRPAPGYRGNEEQNCPRTTSNWGELPADSPLLNLPIRQVRGIHLTGVSQSPQAVPPKPPRQRGHPPSLERPSPSRPWRQIPNSG